ncbi:MAG TPA: NnrS family protein [Polyangiaceae bacterium]|jgi:uncharacterized protein involved in response to NO
MHTLPLLGAAPPSSARVPFPLAAKGFRPFFLAAGLFAVAILPLWLCTLAGVLHPGASLDATSWHAHEMVFGFATAVIAGFLLTAVGNWTQRETVVGVPLLALAGLWVLGRVVMTAGGALPPWVRAAVDLAFFPALLVALARPLIAAKNRRNLVMLAVVSALFAANAAMHLDALGILPGARRRGYLAGVDIVLLVTLIIAGRVFPMFTRNATRVESVRSSPRLDVVAIASMVLLTLLDAFAPESRAVPVVSAIAGIFAAARTVHWGARHSFRIPLLWILHVGYAWIPLGLLLRAAAPLGLFAPGAAALHALTAGAIGSLTLGMMSRVSLGHTGRSLVAPRLAAISFEVITLAAAVRVFVPLVYPAWYGPSLYVSGIAWALAFLLFVIGYAPMLVAPRVDGKAG